MDRAAQVECFLDLIAREELEVDSLISGVFPMENAAKVYADLAAGLVSPVGVLLEYPKEAPPRTSSRVNTDSKAGSGAQPTRGPRPVRRGQGTALDRLHRRG